MYSVSFHNSLLANWLGQILSNPGLGCAIQVTSFILNRPSFDKRNNLLGLWFTSMSNPVKTKNLSGATWSQCDVTVTRLLWNSPFYVNSVRRVQGWCFIFLFPLCPPTSPLVMGVTHLSISEHKDHKFKQEQTFCLNSNRRGISCKDR